MQCTNIQSPDRSGSVRVARVDRASMGRIMRSLFGGGRYASMYGSGAKLSRRGTVTLDDRSTC